MWGPDKLQAGSDGDHVRLTCAAIVTPFPLGELFLQTIICLQKDACGIQRLLVTA